MRHFILSTLLLVCGMVSAHAEENQEIPAGMYILDKTHASIVFSANHVGFSNYTMTFNDFDATLEFDPKAPQKSKIKASVDPKSIDLPSPPAGFTDTLLGKDWLNAAQFPAITFTSNKVEMTGEKTAKIYGTLDLLGAKKSLVLNATFNGGYAGHPMDPKARIGFSATTSFKRSEFGMVYGIPEPGTTMGVGDVVNVAIEAEFSGPPLKEKKEESKGENKGGRHH